MLCGSRYEAQLEPGVESSGTSNRLKLKGGPYPAASPLRSNFDIMFLRYHAKGFLAPDRRRRCSLFSVSVDVAHPRHITRPRISSFAALEDNSVPMPADLLHARSPVSLL